MAEKHSTQSITLLTTCSEQGWKYHNLLCEGDSENSSAKHSSRLKKVETGISKEGTEMSYNNSATKLLWTDETEINLYQSDGKVKGICSYIQAHLRSMVEVEPWLGLASIMAVHPPC